MRVGLSIGQVRDSTIISNGVVLAIALPEGVDAAESVVHQLCRSAIVNRVAGATAHDVWKRG